MEDFTPRGCPMCGEHPTSFTNTASVAGQYRCSASCRGEVTAASEPVTTEIVDVTLDKTVSPTCIRAGGTVHYTITVCNRSSVPVSQVLVTDPDIEHKLDVGTIYLNGRPVCGGSLCRGILVPGLEEGCCAAITFDAVVPAGFTGEVTNTAYAEFEFDSEVCGLTRSSATSGEVVLNVVSPSLEIDKEAEPCAVTREEPVITYTLTVRNTGTCPIEDAVVTDMPPAGLTYVAGSTTVNSGAPFDRNPASGIHLGELDPGESAIITFRAEAEI